MRRQPSREPVDLIGLCLFVLGCVIGLGLATQWFALTVEPAAAALPAAQGTQLPFTPVTPRTPTASPTSTPRPPTTATPGPINVTPVTPPATPGPINATPATPPAPSWQVVGPALLPIAEQRQVMQFNPNAALQKRIFADGLVPNSPEFRVFVGGREYGAQRAESLQTSLVRVYYVAVPDWANVQFVQRPNPRTTVEEAILAEAERRQVIQFNPNAALQQRIFADGFVPNSSEFTQPVSGYRFIGQRAERLDNGVVRVYFVRDGDFGNVFYYIRP